MVPRADCPETQETTNDGFSHGYHVGAACLNAAANPWRTICWHFHSLAALESSGAYVKVVPLHCRSVRDFPFLDARAKFRCRFTDEGGAPGKQTRGND